MSLNAFKSSTVGNCCFSSPACTLCREIAKQEIATGNVSLSGFLFCVLVHEWSTSLENCSDQNDVYGMFHSYTSSF